MSMVEYLNIYTAYITNYNKALNTLDEQIRKNKQFAEFLQSQEENPECDRLLLPAFLIQPIQRIPRYSLLLKELIKNTWEDHPDFRMLVVASKKIEEVAIHINEKKREAENLTKALDVMSSLEGEGALDLALHTRRFVREGALVVAKIAKEGKVNKKDTAERFFFLFHDKLLCCKRKRFKSNKFKFLGSYTLYGASLTDIIDFGESKNRFHLTSNNGEIDLTATSPKDKSDWMKDLKDCISVLQ